MDRHSMGREDYYDPAYEPPPYLGNMPSRAVREARAALVALGIKPRFATTLARLGYRSRDDLRRVPTDNLSGLRGCGDLLVAAVRAVVPYEPEPMTEARESADRQLAVLARETRSSIELTRGARDEYRWSIKRYYDETETGAELAALSEIERVDERLREVFLQEEEAS
jgi:hypothetical protein